MSTSYFRSVLVLVFALTVTVAAVIHLRPPGAMTVLEAQTMDMSSTRPALGLTPVSTETVALVWFQPTVTVLGTVGSSGVAEVTAQKAGRVGSLRVELGQKVQAGQPLLDIDGVPCAAPVSGEVAQRLVEPGALVAAHTPLVRIQPGGPLRLETRLSPEYLDRLKVGAPVEVSRSSDATRFRGEVSGVGRLIDPSTHTFAAALSVPPASASTLAAGESLEIRLALGPAQKLISVPLEAVRRTLDGQAFIWVVENPAGPTTGLPAPVYTCPMHGNIASPGPGKCPECGMALIARSNPTSSAKICTVRRRPLKIWGEDARRAGVDGLVAGEEIVVAGNEELEDGMRVQRVYWGEGGPPLLPPMDTPPRP